MTRCSPYLLRRWSAPSRLGVALDAMKNQARQSAKTGASQNMLAATAAVTASLAVTSMPAAARSEDRDRLEVFGPGERGRIEERGGSTREQFERGYRVGRDDERWSSRGSGTQEVRAAMEFLDYACQQIESGHLRSAWVALGRAETRLASRSLSADSNDEAAAGAAVGGIRAARQALRERNADLAISRTEGAMEIASCGATVGRNVPSSALTGAGSLGPGRPLSG